MSQFKKSRPLVLAAVSLATALLLAGPASAQYYDRGYAPEREYAPRGYDQRRGYGEPRGYDQRRGYDDGRGYGQQRGYGGQGGVYFDKETAKRNARALKEQQKDMIKSGRGAYIAPQPGYQQPRGGGGGGRGYPGLQPGMTAGQNGVPDDPYRNRN